MFNIAESHPVCHSTTVYPFVVESKGSSPSVSSPSTDVTKLSINPHLSINVTGKSHPVNHFPVVLVQDTAKSTRYINNTESESICLINKKICSQLKPSTNSFTLFQYAETSVSPIRNYCFNYMKQVFQLYETV